VSNSAKLTKAEIERASRRFSRISSNRDRVSIRQLAALPEFADNCFVGRVFELHDQDHDGIINHEEFLAALRSIRRIAVDPAARMEMAFKLFDLDADGQVSVDDLAKVLQCTAAKGVKPEQLKAAAKHAVAAHDTEGDGGLDLNEFQGMVQRSIGTAPAMSC